MILFTFIHDGIHGYLESDSKGNEFVIWAGMGFQLDAALNPLRKSIEAARQ